MKKIFNLTLFVISFLATGILTNAQVTRTRTAAVNGVINTSPVNLSQFQVEGALITQNSFIAPAAANFTGSFTATARWNSMGNLNAGTQTLNGFRTQTNGRALASGHSISNLGGVLSNPFIQWIGNATAGVAPGALDFKFAVNPGGVGIPAPDVTLFKMAPTAAGTSGDSYAQNGTLGHLQSGNFGDISGAAQWLGHGPARIAGVLDPTIYGNRIQQGAQSMLFNLVSGKPVVGWGDQGQDMVFRYFQNNLNPSLFTDVLTLRADGRSNFGPTFSTTPKVTIRGTNPNGLEILVKTTPFAVQTGGDAWVVTGTQDVTGFYGKAQSTGEGATIDVVLRNTGVRGDAGTDISILEQLNIGVRGEANPNSINSTNYGVYGACAANPAAAFTAGGYFIGGLYADGVIVMSDQRLKNNIVKEEGISERIMELRPVNYMMDQKRKGYQFSNKLQHGFIAQEMEKVFPELVNNIKHPITENGKTTFEDIKGVNYVGLVSVLTRGMQEQQEKIISQDKKIEIMQKELQELKLAIQNLNGVTPSKGVNTNANLEFQLKQNVPNPFNVSTIISFNVPSSEKNVSIAIFDLNGKMITQYSNLNGKNQVTVNANELQPGIYLYSLLAGGQEVLTKRMVVTK